MGAIKENHKVDLGARFLKERIMHAVLNFPDISPVVFTVPLGPYSFPIYWYAVAYIVGIVLARWIVLTLIRRPWLWKNETPPLTPDQWESLVTWIIVGIIAGGRLGYVLFYADWAWWLDPLRVLNLRDGGMSFHGGFAGVVIAGLVFCLRNGIRILPLADAIAVSTPQGLLFGRLANFVNAELWGRETDLPWAFIFPGIDAQTCTNAIVGMCARHPSQLYEAAGEGLILGAILFYLAFRTKALQKSGLLMGLFIAGYGTVRFLVEFVRQPDAQFVSETNPIGYAVQFSDMGLTMGQILSLPMILVGLFFVVRAK